MAGAEILDALACIVALKSDPAFAALFPVGQGAAFNTDYVMREPPDVYVALSTLGAPDTNAVGGYRVFNAPELFVDVVGKEVGYDVTRPIFEYIDAKLTDKAGSRLVGTTWVYRFVRQNVVPRADTINNVRWYYLGGVYTTVVFTV